MLKRHLAAKTLEKLLHNELCPDVEAPEVSLALKLKQKLMKKEAGRDEK